MSQLPAGHGPHTLSVAQFAAEPSQRQDDRPSVPARLSPLDDLADRLLPAVFFGSLGAVNGLATLGAALSRPAEPGMIAGLVWLLGGAHGILAVAFYGLIATLFLVRRAPRGGRAGTLTRLVALAGTFGMGAVGLQPTTAPDGWLLVLGSALLVAGLAFATYAAARLGDCFGLAAEARGLVTSGAYRLVRHPLYLGELVGALGIVVPALSPLTALVFATFCLCQLARARLEEQVLATRFPEYAAYRRRTPALLPWPRPA
jgi:protein-S-isoprenylcysteine O-methyltransferase Ste14